MNFYIFLFLWVILALPVRTRIQQNKINADPCRSGSTLHKTNSHYGNYTVRLKLPFLKNGKITYTAIAVSFLIVWRLFFRNHVPILNTRHQLFSALWERNRSNICRSSQSINHPPLRPPAPPPPRTKRARGNINAKETSSVQDPVWSSSGLEPNVTFMKIDKTKKCTVKTGNDVHTTPKSEHEWFYSLK